MKSKKNVTIVVRLNQDQLFKIKHHDKNISKTIRKCIDEYFKGPNLITMNENFAQYEYKEWIITIESNNQGEFNGFATTKKYSEILTIHNYYFIDDIAKEHNITFIEDGDNDYICIDKDFKYLLAECNDVLVNHLEGIDTTNINEVLNYIIKLINEN